MDVMAARETAPIFPPAGRKAGRHGRVRARRSVSLGGWSRVTGGAGLLREPGLPAEPAERGVKETPRSPSEPCRTLSRHTAPRWMACVNRYRPRSRLAEPSITVWRLGRCTFGAFQTRRRIISQGEVLPFRHWRLDHRALGHLDSASRLFLPSIVAQVGRSPSLAHPPFSGGFRPVTRRAPGRGHSLFGPSCHLGLLASSLPAIDHAGSAEMVSTFLLFVFRER